MTTKFKVGDRVRWVGLNDGSFVPELNLLGIIEGDDIYNYMNTKEIDRIDGNNIYIKDPITGEVYKESYAECELEAERTPN